jgi:hypothetical protein
MDSSIDMVDMADMVEIVEMAKEIMVKETATWIRRRGSIG